MATNQVLRTIGTSFVWSNSTYSPTAASALGVYSATYDIDMVGLTVAQARMSLKADLGASRAEFFSVDMTMEMATDPISGEMWDIYWSESSSGTAATDNTGGVSGADADYAGYNTLTLAESLRHLVFIGSLVMGAANTGDTGNGIQHGHVGVFSPMQRYGVLVVHNQTSDIAHSDSVEMGVRFTPLIPDIQAAA